MVLDVTFLQNMELFLEYAHTYSFKYTLKNIPFNQKDTISYMIYSYEVKGTIF